METHEDVRQISKTKTIYIVLFFVLNILNGFLVTTTLFIPQISPYPRTWFMVINYVLGDLGYITLFFAVSILLFRMDKNRFRFLMIITIIHSVVCIAMSMFVYNYGMFFSFANLKILLNSDGSTAFAFILSTMGVLLANAQYLSLIPAVVLIVFFSRIMKRRKAIYETTSMMGRTRSRLFLGISLSLIGGLLMANTQSIYRYEIEETWYQDNQEVLYGIQTMGLYNYYVYDFYSYYVEGRASINEEKIREIELYLESKESLETLNLIDGATYGNREDLRGLYQDKHLLLIQAESLSNFVIGLHVNGKEITPNLNRMAQNGTYFNRFYSTVGIGNTGDAEFSVMTGLYPKGEELMVYAYMDTEYETLAKDFNASNYYTFSMHGNVSTFYNRNTVHTDNYGFQDMFGQEHIEIDTPMVHNWISDRDLLILSLNRMHSSMLPTFAFSVLVSCHTPYVVDETIAALLEEKEFSLEDDIENAFVRGYLEHCYYVDDAIGQLLTHIETLNIQDDVVIALYGDHGGGINASQFIEHQSIFTNALNPFDPLLFDVLNPLNKLAYRKIAQEIPFIIYECQEEKLLSPQTISKVRGEVDIYRTLSNLFGLTSKYYFGVDALSDAPTFIYNPRNLDVFTDSMMLAVPSGEAIYESSEATQETLSFLSQITRVKKDMNDKILKYLNLFSQSDE